MSSQKFQRRIEDFVCEHCGAAVKGDGYTNHCPQCLWSKHVDVNPGDRASICEGLMEPVAIEGKTTQYRIVHRCVRCNFEHINNVSNRDNADALIALASKIARKSYQA